MSVIPRTPVGGARFWNKWTCFGEETIHKNLKQIQQPSGNPVYRPQFVFNLMQEHGRLIISRYSRGDEVSGLPQHFSGLLDAWELSNRLADDICREHGLKTCRDWTFALSNLEHYNWCFWLVGLALSLEIPDDQWGRLLTLVGGAGEDELLDRAIVSRQLDRRIGKNVLHAEPYARLLKAIDAPRDLQAALLREFVVHWYPELARTGKQRLWWYDYGDPVALEMGSYFGRWCIEAVAAVKAFGMDDSLCLNHPHYPGDLMQDGRSPRYPDSELSPDAQAGSPEPVRASGAKDMRSWLSRLISGREGNK